ncbi:MAG: hypothetical protein FWC76_06760 [Defluviitaleaceae bacterium]|nr:hypothetical protein [Defluviitaleaceae bacterium]
MLKKRPFAWILAVAVMILSVFIGAYTSYAGMRNTAAGAFDAQIMPVVHEAMVPAFRMQQAVSNYLSDAELRAIGIGPIVDEIQATDDPARIYQLFVELNRAVWAIYDRLDDISPSDANRAIAINSHADFMSLDTIISQAGYNNIARDFNEALGSNLGFLVGPFIDEMPRFD